MGSSETQSSVLVNRKEAGILAMSLVFYGVFYQHWCQECDDLLVKLLAVPAELTPEQKSAQDAVVHNLRLANNVPVP